MCERDEALPSNNGFRKKVEIACSKHQQSYM